ncbi:hypothetical protein TNCV_3529691 [Trichonephila clavipes]|uniref:Uncharacterized protein n=1 Tax=Trichonephila clavipes TaxID=2585209 RepID=A0A8X6RJS5_TRICX|nr:hypothetical protein TNCV_3529691 [Trichonephila clavipes]
MLSYEKPRHDRRYPSHWYRDCSVSDSTQFLRSFTFLLFTHVLLVHYEGSSVGLSLMQASKEGAAGSLPSGVLLS